MSKPKQSKRAPDAAPSSGKTPAAPRVDSRRAQRVIQQQRARRRKQLMTLGGAGVVALAVVIALVVYFQRDDSAGASTAPVVIPTPVVASIQTDGHTMGDPNAPVKVTEYGDFQCPACGQFFHQGSPQLIQDYVASGKVLFEFHDFPFIDRLPGADGDESHDASEAAFCAQDQGKFWEYHDALYASQVGENEGAFKRQRLDAIAQQVGLDMAAFGSCMDSGEHEDDVQASYDAAQSIGINQTPTFIVNGTQVVGANYSALKQAIDTALAGQ